MSRDTVYHNRRHISLNQRSYIRNELTGYVSSVSDHPLRRNKLLIIGDLMNILNLRSALIRIVRKSLKNNHLTTVSLTAAVRHLLLAAPATGSGHLLSSPASFVDAGHRGH